MVPSVDVSLLHSQLCERQFSHQVNGRGLDVLHCQSPTESVKH